jgi:hypothetical protein
MLKKITIAVLIAFLAAAPLFGIAAAQTDIPPGSEDGRAGGKKALGQVTSIGESFFTTKTRNGEFTLQVTENTVFKNRDGSEASFGDLSVGRWVVGVFVQDDEGNLTARLVVLLPEDFDPSNIKPVRLRGEVDKINNGQDTFTILTPDGRSLTIHVDDNTRWLGTLTELKDLEKGMRVGVGAVEQESGSLLAKAVAAGVREKIEGKRAAGKVASAGSGSLTIDTQSGSMTFSIIEKTRFVSQDGSIKSLEDLEIGQGVLVIYVEREGEFVALVVGAGDGKGLRAKKAGGTVQSAGGSHLTIQTRNSQKMSFTVDGNTIIKSKDSSVNDLNDLKNGMPVIVVYVIQEDGTLLAKIIGVGSQEKPDKDTPPGSESPERDKAPTRRG